MIFETKMKSDLLVVWAGLFPASQEWEMVDITRTTHTKENCTETSCFLSLFLFLQQFTLSFTVSATMPFLKPSTMLVVAVLLSATLLQRVAASPEPMITAAAVLYQHEKREMSSRLAVARQLDPYLEMCYGGGNSICDIYLKKDCSTDMDNWYQCICETGYLAAEFA